MATASYTTIWDVTRCGPRSSRWQTDFTCLRVAGRGWCCPSTVPDDLSRFVVDWRLCSTMKAEDVTATLTRRRSRRRARAA